MRRSLHVALCMAAIAAGFALPGSAPAQTAADGLTREPVEFTVSNPDEGGAQRRIVGYRYDPSCQATTAVLLMHGLSYTAEAWDFPGYSVAQRIADAGYATFAIDRLGYGGSKLDDGYKVTHEGYAAMANEIAGQLRSQGFEHIVMGGHSAGAGTTELAASLYGGVDAIMALGWHHRPSDQIVKDFFTGDYVRAAQDDYEYFLGTPEHRAAMFYNENADPAVVAADTEAAVLTPSGEIFSIGKQPSRLVVSQVDVPVFLQFGDGDRLFEVRYAEMHAREFSGSPSVTVDVVTDAGHTFMLTENGRAGSDRMAAWLVSRPETPSCR